MSTRSARKRKRQRAMLDKLYGVVIVVKNPRCPKPYYDISLGYLAAAAEWRAEMNDSKNNSKSGTKID